MSGGVEKGGYDCVPSALMAVVVRGREVTPARVAAAVGLGAAGLCGVLLFCLLCRRCVARCRRGRKEYEYSSVCHELDREELDFKRALESQCGDLEAAGEARFNDAELEQIEMIERYRSSLVGADADGAPAAGVDAAAAAANPLPGLAEKADKGD